MSELEPSRAGPLEPEGAQQPEPWPKGWSWFVRILGAATMVQQVWFEQEDRQWLLLCAMGMMLGEIGLKAGLRFLMRNVGGQQ